MGKVVRITVYGMEHNVFVMRVGMGQPALRMIHHSYAMVTEQYGLGIIIAFAMPDGMEAMEIGVTNMMKIFVVDTVYGWDAVVDVMLVGADILGVLKI